MKYNISYSIAAALILIVYYVYVRLVYTTPTRANKLFRQVIVWIFAADVMDAFTAVTISYADRFSNWFNYPVNIFYYLLCASAAYMVPRYVKAVLTPEHKKDKIDLFFYILIHVYYALQVTDPFTKWIFYFDEQGNFFHGKYYFLVFSFSLLCLGRACVQLIIYGKRLKRKQYVPLYAFVFLIGGASLLQSLVLPDILISYFAASIGILVLLFSLETPDYKQLIQTLEQLEKAQKEAEEAKEEAFAANRAKSSFLANMSHEIRTPINGILGMNEIAIKDNKDPAIEDCLLNIQDAGKSLLTLINEILDFSKIESGKMEIVEEKYDLASVMYSAYNLINSKALGKNLTLKVRNDPSIPAILKGDSSRIQQIMVNLLNNGVKYTNEGSVELFVDYRPSLDNLIDLVITVSDTGIGIADEDLDKLFKSFQRVDLEKNRSIEGTGLGLMITKQLAELMGGTVFVESTLGVGSKFHAVIPQEVMDKRPLGEFSPVAKKILTKPTDTLDYNFEGHTILVVDDVMVNLKVVAGLLKRTNLKIDMAKSGQECIDMCKEKKYDVVLLDHMMPEMDGVETFKIIRNGDDLNKGTPIIVLTANAIQGIEDEYRAIGFNDYLSKPIDSNKLKAMLNKYFEM